MLLLPEEFLFFVLDGPSPVIYRGFLTVQTKTPTRCPFRSGFPMEEEPDSALPRRS